MCFLVHSLLNTRTCLQVPSLECLLSFCIGWSEPLVAALIFFLPPSPAVSVRSPVLCWTQDSIEYFSLFIDI